MRRTRILAIDGGGIRGIIPAKVLAAFEEQAGAPISELFDLVIGTSTGGLIALALTTPGENGKQPRYTADDVVRLYQTEGPTIFKPRAWRRALRVRRAPYPPHHLEGVLARFFGDARLSQSLTEVAITAYNIENRRPYIFSVQGTKSTDRQGQLVEDYFIRDVARATTAAPTYFQPACIYPIAHQGDSAHRRVLVDGGVFANNPAFAGLVEGLRAANSGELGSFILVSVGTGSQIKQYMYEAASRWGLIQWASHILDIVFDGVSDHVDERLKGLLTSGNYHRFQVSLDASMDALDDARPSNIQQLLGLATGLVKSREAEIRTLVDELKSPSTRPTRLTDLAAMSSEGQIAVEDVAAIADNTLKAFERTYSPFTDQVLHQLSGLRQASSDWGDGQILVSGIEYYDLVDNIYRNARRSIHATVVPEFIREVWGPNLRPRVLAAHRSSGAEVKRIFVFNNRNELVPELVEEMQSQHEAGFEVRAYFREDELFQFSPDIAKSFTIVDGGDAIGVVELIDRERAQCRWYFRDDDRRRFFVSVFEQLEAASVPWSEIAAQSGGAAAETV